MRTDVQDATDFEVAAYVPEIVRNVKNFFAHLTRT
jgi:hypothetical protein